MTEGSPPKEFDHYARLVRRLLGVPVGLVSLVEPERQVFVGAVGLPEEYMESRETPLSHSFCQYVVKDARPLIVSDARENARLSENLAIEDLDVVAYAGWPVSDHTGRVIGSLCAIDSSPRDWSAEDIETLEDLAAACSAELSQRERADGATTALTSAEETGEETRALLALSTALSVTDTLAEVAAAVVRISTQELGCLRAGVWLRDSEVVEHESRSRARRLGRTGSGHRETPSLGSIETLTFLVDLEITWASAETFASLPMDETNPLGQALQQSRLVTFETRQAQNDVFPHLANPDQLGEARAYLPLRLGGRAFGALALVWPERRRFSDQDRVSMAALASYTAQAIQRAQLLQGQADVALTLQHAMLTTLPKPPALSLAARYLPAGAHAEIGGDWYDAVLTPSGMTYVVIGDVVGHDIQAAATMGQLRSMLRMTAWLSSGTSGTPAREVELLDRALHDLGVETQATLVVARIEPYDDVARPGLRRLRWTNAGHPPPLLVEPDGTARLLEDDAARGPMLGFMPATDRDDAVVLIRPESRLLLYTDGLVERRGESIDVGLGRLVEAARRHAGRTDDEFLERILDDLVDDDLDDDVALLTVSVGAE